MCICALWALNRKAPPFMKAIWKAQLFRILREIAGRVNLPCHADFLRFAGGAVAQEVGSRGFYDAGGLERSCCVAEAVGREFAQAYALHIEYIVILESVLL